MLSGFLLKFILYLVWIGIQYVNQTFDDEFDFDVEEIYKLLACE